MNSNDSLQVFISSNDPSSNTRYKGFTVGEVSVYTVHYQANIWTHPLILWYSFSVKHNIKVNKPTKQKTNKRKYENYQVFELSLNFIRYILGRFLHKYDGHLLMVYLFNSSIKVYK